MNIKDFTTNFIGQLDDDSLESINKDENFRELEAWDSLTALSIMAMLDENYDVNLTAKEMKTANTIQQLYILVATKKGIYSEPL